jgi:hypothetical protein
VLAEVVVAAACSKCQVENLTIVQNPNQQVYSVEITALLNPLPSVTTYTVITPVGPGGLIYGRNRVGRLPQFRILQIKPRETK